MRRSQNLPGPNVTDLRVYVADAASSPTFQVGFYRQRRWNLRLHWILSFALSQCHFPRPPLQGGEMGFAHGDRLPRIVSSRTTIRIIWVSLSTEVAHWTGISIQVMVIFAFPERLRQFLNDLCKLFLCECPESRRSDVPKGA